MATARTNKEPGKPGRIATDGAKDVRAASITLTKEDREIVRARGGSAFVRAAIRHYHAHLRGAKHTAEVK